MVMEKVRVAKCVCIACGVIHYRALADSFVRGEYTWRIGGMIPISCGLEICEICGSRILISRVRIIEEARERTRKRRAEAKDLGWRHAWEAGAWGGHQLRIPQEVLSGVFAWSEGLA